MSALDDIPFLDELPVVANKADLIEIDAFELMKKPAPPVKFLVDGIFPLGGTGDLFAPPGEGKSSLSLSLALAIASGVGKWYGVPCKSGKVVILGGERSDTDCFHRDLERAGNFQLKTGSLIIPKNPDGDDAIWTWDKKNEVWLRTKWGERLTNYLIEKQPALTILDTVLSVARGCDQINNTQQYALGETIRKWTKTISPTMNTLTISHTNQASSSTDSDLEWRLNWLSRAGGSGLPGSFRWMAGLSKLREKDKFVIENGLQELVKTERLIAFAVSKHNEMGSPICPIYKPMIFKMEESGELTKIDCNVKKSASNYQKAAQPTKKGVINDENDW